MKRIENGIITTATPGELPVGVPGAFETLLLRGGEPVFWAEHWSRFEEGCAKQRLAAPAGRTIRAGARDLATANQVDLGVLRYAVWMTPDGKGCHRIDVTPPRPHMAKPAFRAVWGPPLPPPDDDRRFKHLRRQAWQLAQRDARAAGYDDVILPDGQMRLVETGSSNVFFVQNGVLHTPSLALGGLPGIMRGQVLACARGAGWPTQEGSFAVQDLDSADEVWLTNSLIGVRPVTEINTRPLPSSRPVLDRFREIWAQRHGWDPLIIA